MAGKNKTSLLGWHPPAELAAWAREEAGRRGGRGALSALLTEALAEKRHREEAPSTPPRCAQCMERTDSGGRHFSTGDVRCPPATPQDRADVPPGA